MARDRSRTRSRPAPKHPRIPEPSFFIRCDGRRLIAAGSFLYAVVLITGSLLGDGHIHELFPGADLLNALAAALCGLIALGVVPVSVRAAAAYVVYFWLVSVLSVLGQLYQRYVPDDRGLYILIDRITFASSLGSALALLIALIGVVRTLRRAG